MKKYHKTSKNRTNIGKDAVSGIIGFPFNLWLWGKQFQEEPTCGIRIKSQTEHIFLMEQLDTNTPPFRKAMIKMSR